MRLTSSDFGCYTNNKLLHIGYPCVQGPGLFLCSKMNGSNTEIRINHCYQNTMQCMYIHGDRAITYDRASVHYCFIADVTKNSQISCRILKEMTSLTSIQ